jgi:hypothetical protein
MRSSRLCALASMLVVAVVPARLARALDVPAAPDPPLVRLALVDLYGLPPDGAARAAAEVAAVLDRLGARTEVRWREASGPDDPRDLVVVVMPGDPGRRLKRTVMGAVQRDAPTRVLWVFPMTIARVLGLSPEAGASRTPEERAVFERAFGRVVVHEVVHIVCPWRAHDASGLMAAHVSQATLRGVRFEPDASLRRDFVLGATARGDRSPLVARSRPPLD